MLHKLYIKNFALVNEVEIDFCKNLNIVTGETGTGKSILVEAINLILGERASLEQIRQGSEKSIIEANFQFQKLPNELIEIFNENEIEISNEITLRREISQTSTNRIFLNDSQITLSTLKKIGENLVDLHGQHEHQSLLKNENHIDFLDRFANLENEVLNFKLTFKEIKKLVQEKNSLTQKEKELKERLSILEFQLSEIEKTNPILNEDELLEN